MPVGPRDSNPSSHDHETLAQPQYPDAGLIFCHYVAF